MENEADITLNLPVMPGEISKKTCVDSQEKHEPAIGEVALWRGVILQAFTDMLMRTHTPEKIRQQEQAQYWLIRGCYDFRLVCSMAGLDHEYVSLKAKIALIARRG